MASVSGSSTLSADSSGKHKSDVWQYFTKDKERKKAKCQLCSKEFVFHSGTTNLREHLMNRQQTNAWVCPQMFTACQDYVHACTRI